MPKNEEKGGGKGQSKFRTFVRTNPETGQPEEAEFTQAEWRQNGKQYRAEGWTPKDETEVAEDDDTGEGQPTEPDPIIE